MGCVRSINGNIRQRVYHVVAEPGRGAVYGVLGGVVQPGDASQDAELGGFIFGVVEGAGGEDFKLGGVGDDDGCDVEKVVDVLYVSVPVVKVSLSFF